MESLPQIHLILVIVFTDEIEVDRSHWRTWLPFAVSVVSAAYGMTKFFSVGPCRSLPYDRMGVGFFLVIINISKIFKNGSLKPRLPRFINLDKSLICTVLTPNQLIYSLLKKLLFNRFIFFTEAARLRTGIILIDYNLAHLTDKYSLFRC